MLTAPELHRSYQTSIALLRQLCTEAGLHELDLVDSAALRADARRFATRLAGAADAAAAKSLIFTDHPGAEAFWFLVRTRWDAMETFLMPGAFELLPEPRLFDVLCHCEQYLEDTVSVENEGSDDAATDGLELPPKPDSDLEWERSTHSGEMPGLPRPVRIAFASPELASEEVGEEGGELKAAIHGSRHGVLGSAGSYEVPPSAETKRAA